MRLPAVIAAYNEAERVGAVVKTVLQSGLYLPIVVDDGSSDNTVDVAARAGAIVIKQPQNLGKAQAMKTGWEYARCSDVAFFDADIVGLTIEHCYTLFSGYVAGYDQTCGLRDYVSLANPAQVFTPIITGERIVRSWVLEEVPWDCWEGFNIETAINETCDAFGGKTCCFILQGLKNTVKEKKRGVLAGLKQNYKMFTGFRKAKNMLRSNGGTSCKVR